MTNMKTQMRWFALVAGFATLIAGSLGCATMAATNAASNHSDFYNRPVLSDEIVAIGRPDAEVAKSIGQPDAVAFLGQKNTYLVYKGGAELESIFKLKLDGKRLRIESVVNIRYADRSSRLYLKDKQVWGNLVLAYVGDGNGITPEEQAELEKAGFNKQGNDKYVRYDKSIAMEGVISPPVKLSDDQASQLAMHRPINFYNPGDAKPPANIGATLMIPVAVVADVILIPVYLGVAVVALIASAAGH